MGVAANAASFGLSALLLRGLRSGEAPRPVSTTIIWKQSRQALGLLGRDRLLRALAIAQALAALSAGATGALLVVLAADQLDVTGAGYGFMLSAIAVGAFCGPLLLTRLGSRARSPRILFGAFGLRGLVDLVLATVTALPAAVAALVAYGIGTSAGNVTFSSTLQSHVPEQMRGRVFAAFDLIWQAMRLASLLLGGLLADTVGISAVFYIGGVLLLAAALAGATAAGPGRGPAAA
jgi:MFS family permease